jgi:NHLM bacteriocin system ABC transporter ATP-binding protein
MTTDSTLFNAAGTGFRPGVNRPFPVEDPASVWIVQAGKLDLFLVRLKDGEAAGARRPVMRVEEGHAVFGIGEVHPDWTIVATAVPGTQLLEVSLVALREALADGRADQVRSLVEPWILQLSALVSTIAPSQASATLQPAGELKLSYQPQPVMPRDGVLWVKHLQGSSRFIDDPAFPVNGNGWFPVSRQGWLQAEPQSRLMAIGWDLLDQNDPGWQGLEAFHRVFAQCLLRKLCLADEGARTRLRSKAEADMARVENAIAGLATPLLPEMAPAAAGQPHSDPLLLAAQAVGRVQGIDIKAYPDMLGGLKPRDPVAAVAKASGIHVRQVLLKAGWQRQDSGPMLAFRESDQRPLALIPNTARSYRVYDPVERSTTVVTDRLAATLRAFAYVFYRPFPPKALTAADLIGFGLHACRNDVRMVLLMGLATGLLGMFTPFATGVLFDTVIPGAQRTELLQLSVILLVCAISTAMFSLTRSVAMLRLEGKMDAAVQAAVWDRLLSLPIPFFRDYTAGDLAVRGMGIDQMRQTLTGSTLASILSGVFSVFSFALLFYYNSSLAVMAAGLILVAFLVSLACGSLQVRYLRDMSRVRGHLSGLILQFINGIAKFRVAGTEQRAFAAWSKDFAVQKQLSLRARWAQNSLTVFNAAFPVAASACIFWYTADLMKKPGSDPMTTGDFLAFNAAFTQLLAAVLQLSASIVSVLAIVPLYERAKPIFQTLPEVDIAKTAPGSLRGNVEVNHVQFRYRPDAPLVLRDVSLCIKSGEFVALVGASGCGKSTLFRMLLGFEKPESGAVYYDGQDLGGLDAREVRRQMGVVLQNGRLLSGDIFTNIIGSAPLTLDDAWEAARMSGLEQDIRNMPMGMHTVVSEGGGGLSGGQRQRLMIARAIVGRPRILLFDEATSALDNQTQAIVANSLSALQATRIVIAHRLSTVVKADRIFVLDKGRVVEEGAYGELIAQGGPFAELARRQLT